MSVTAGSDTELSVSQLQGYVFLTANQTFGLKRHNGCLCVGSHAECRTAGQTDLLSDALECALVGISNLARGISCEGAHRHLIHNEVLWWQVWSLII